MIAIQEMAGLVTWTQEGRLPLIEDGKVRSANSELASRLPAQDGLSEGGSQGTSGHIWAGTPKSHTWLHLVCPSLGKRGPPRTALPALFCGFVRFR